MRKFLLIGSHPNEIGGISTFINNILKINPENFTYFSNSRYTFFETKYSLLNKVQKTIYSAYNNLKFIIFLLKNNKNIKGVIIVTPSKYAFFDSIYYILISKFFRQKTYLRYAGDLMSFYTESNYIIKKAIQLGLKTPYKNIVQSQRISSFIKQDIKANTTIDILPEVIMSIQEKRNTIRTPTNLIFFGGSEAIRKGSMEVINSIIQINESKNNFHFYLIAIPKAQEEKIESYNFKNISIINKIFGGEKDILMKKMNILLLPSYKEGMPNAILDALSYGMGIITTRVGSIPEVLKEKENAFFISAGNVEELSHTIKEYEDLEVLTVQSSNNIKLAQDYNQNKFKEKLDEILQ